ncbi:hypothetical protein SFRURICE_012537 [Spodoptera frugiperda]|nr:hypothetical protein SFRURICE_012537 [Spodoptera frugiperda]
MEKSDNKTKTMWNIIKQKTKKPQKNIGNNISLKYNNQTINCPETISNLFNEYFTTVGLNPNDTNQSHNKKGRPVVNPPECSIHHINWKTHIEHIKSKLSKFTYALFQIKCSTNVETALSAYFAYAYSWLRYGIMLWGDSVNIHDLFILQKKCVRIIAQINNQDSCRPYFIKYNLLTLPSIYIYDICKFVFKNKNSFTKVEDTHNVNTRHKNRLYLPPSRIKMLNQSPYYMAVKIFNKLPKDLQNETKETIFTRKLKKILIQKCFYSIKEFFEEKQNNKIKCQN